MQRAPWGWRPTLRAVSGSAPAAPAFGAEAQLEAGPIVPMPGPWAREREVMCAGADMAVHHSNAAGGIASLGGAPLELVVCDTGDSVERAENSAQRLVTRGPKTVYPPSAVAAAPHWPAP